MMTNYEKIKNMTVEEFVKHRLRMCPDGRTIGGNKCLWKPITGMLKCVEPFINRTVENLKYWSDNNGKR